MFVKKKKKRIGVEYNSCVHANRRADPIHIILFFNQEIKVLEVFWAPRPTEGSLPLKVRSSFSLEPNPPGPSLVGRALEIIYRTYIGQI